MRIVQIITRRELRGAEVVAADLCRSLMQRGHEVALIGLFAPPDRTEADSLARNLTHVFDLGGRKRRGFQYPVLSALRKTLIAFRPDIVQANAFNALKFAALTKITSRARWPLVYRNVGLASRWLTRPGQRMWGRLLLRHVAQVISVSDASRADFSETYRVPETDIVVTNQGVTIPRHFPKAEWRAKLAALIGCPTASPLLVHVGNFAPEKNHVGLLRAFSQVLQRHPDCHLALMGDGPLRNQIGTTAAQLNVSPRVHLLGAQTQAADLAGGADVMLLSSHIEGIPGVLLEACARQLPVVSTDVGGISEIIRHNQTGVLVDAGEMVTLGVETARLLSQPALCEQLGKAAQGVIRNGYEMGQSVDKLEAIFQQLVVGAGSQPKQLRSTTTTVGVPD